MLPSCCLGIVQTALVTLLSWRPGSPVGLLHTRRSLCTSGVPQTCPATASSQSNWCSQVLMYHLPFEKFEVSKGYYIFLNLKIKTKQKAETFPQKTNDSKWLQMIERHIFCRGRSEMKCFQGPLLKSIERQLTSPLLASTIGGSYGAVWTHLTAVCTDVSSR